MFYRDEPEAAPKPTLAELVDHELVSRVARYFEPAVRYFGGELHGAHNLPTTGGALLVANHAFLAVDSTVMVPLIYRETGRLPRGLVEKLLFKSRRMGAALHRIGAVEGTRENAITLLEEGELCLCYPGGAEESLKGPQNRYRLRWERSMGYLKVAIQAGVPIVPVVGVGVDEAFPSIARERFFARRIMGHARYDLPIVLGLGPLPLPAKFDFHIGEPWLPPADVTALDDPEKLSELHQGFWSRTQALLDEKLAERDDEPSWMTRWARRLAS